ncbi:hypothetical protein SAMN06298216_3262 [Spirosomataceae bacterium TFI 002]|nr:hypothetical protein SAMN06298216_3262 [Spirosomataceae bacterium TFI 002]
MKGYIDLKVNYITKKVEGFQFLLPQFFSLLFVDRSDISLRISWILDPKMKPQNDRFSMHFRFRH